MMTENPPASAASGEWPERDALYVSIEAAVVVGHANFMSTGKEIGVARYITEAVYQSLTNWTLDDLRDRIEQAIHDRCATFEVQFDGGPGDVVGVPDAALIAAKEVLSGRP